MSGGFRAPLAADWSSGDINKLLGVGLNANGEVVKGDATTKIVGVIVLTKVRKAGDIVDVMTAGEVVEFDPVTAGTLSAAGTVWYAAAVTGIPTATSATGVTRIGHSVEAGRLVVRVQEGQVPA